MSKEDALLSLFDFSRMKLEETTFDNCYSLNFSLLFPTVPSEYIEQGNFSR